jgi:hypothetical protein
VAEILNKERFISCHSYVQSEILMLMNVAEKFNSGLTFTHILEGYKVADKMNMVWARPLLQTGGLINLK